jgi:hypothetical protein
VVSDRQTVSQAIAECLQCGEAAKLLSKQGYGMTKLEMEKQGMTTEQSERAYHIKKYSIGADYSLDCPTCATRITTKTNKALVELLAHHIETHCQATCIALSLA